MDAEQITTLANGPGAGAGMDDAGADAALCETVRRLKAVLRPVEPSATFRQDLQFRLTRAARRDRSAVQIAPTGELSREMLVGAALLSVVGALVYLWRTRVPQAAPRAVTLRDNRPPANEMPFTVA